MTESVDTYTAVTLKLYTLFLDCLLTTNGDFSTISLGLKSLSPDLYFPSPLPTSPLSWSANKYTIRTFPLKIYLTVLPKRLRLFCFHLQYGLAPVSHWALALEDLLSLGAKVGQLVLFSFNTSQRNCFDDAEVVDSALHKSSLSTLAMETQFPYYHTMVYTPIVEHCC